jgi:hypothetical protein
MSTLSNRWFGVFALSVMSLGSACSESSEQASEQDTAAVAEVATRIVYYAIPG